MVPELLKTLNPSTFLDSSRQIKTMSTQVNEPESGSVVERVRSNDKDIVDLQDTPEPVPCEFCGSFRYWSGIKFGDSILWMHNPECCTCPEGVASYEKAKAQQQAEEEAERKAKEARKLDQRIRRIIGESGMGDRFLRRTFDTFEITDNNRRAAAIARRYAESFETLLPKKGQSEPGRNGLFIAGPDRNRQDPYGSCNCKSSYRTRPASYLHDHDRLAGAHQTYILHGRHR